VDACDVTSCSSGAAVPDPETQGQSLSYGDVPKDLHFLDAIAKRSNENFRSGHQYNVLNEREKKRMHTIVTGIPDTVFNEGDNVVLARGPYVGTPGVFLRSRADIKWADVIERNGMVKRHPLEWLARAAIDS
jgi:hypothetical protein